MIDEIRWDEFEALMFEGRFAGFKLEMEIAEVRVMQSKLTARIAALREILAEIGP